MHKLTFLSLLILSAQTLTAQVIKKNLGPNVNTKYEDISPIITPDGKTLYYVIEDHPKNEYGYSSNSQDIWYSTKDTSGKWSVCKHMGFPFNQKKYNSIESISNDGSILYIRGYYEDGEYEKAGFSYSIKTKTGWTKPQGIEIDNYSKIQKGTTSAIWISNDGIHMILSLGTSSSEKVNDLYLSKKIGPNHWSTPVAIKPLNTKKFTESTPFLASDNHTLYFSSNRDGGQGNRDIYMSRRLDDTWMKWSTPINLGPDINTSEWDAYLTTDAEGKDALITSTDLSYGENDIYKINLPIEFRPYPVTVVSGKISSIAKNDTLISNIAFRELGKNKVCGEAFCNSLTNNFTVYFSKNKSYEVYLKNKNYIPVNYVYQTVNMDSFNVANIELKSKWIDDNVYYTFKLENSTKFTENDQFYLNQLTDIMKYHTDKKIEIYYGSVNGNTFKNSNAVDIKNKIKAQLILLGIAPTQLLMDESKSPELDANNGISHADDNLLIVFK